MSEAVQNVPNDPQQNAPPAPIDAAEVARLQAEVAELRQEAADRRVAARSAEEAKTAAEKGKAEAEGRWADVVRLEKAEREKTATDLAAARRRVAELEPYESTVKGEVAALRAKLGDKAPDVAGLNDAQALKILRHVETVAARPGAAPATTSGNPPPVAGAPDLSRMSPEEIRAHIATLNTEEVRKLAEQHGGIVATRRPFS
jgi:hypothetical protein